MVAKLSDRIEGLPYNGVRVGDPVSLLENDVPYATEGQLVNDNLLINSNFDFWQRGTSFTTSNVYGADRWKLDEVTNGTFQRVFAPPTYPDSGVKNNIPQYYSNSSTNRLILANILEYEDIKPLWGKTVTVSCWVRCSVEGHPFGFSSQKSVDANSDSNWTGLAGGTYNSSTTPQRFSFTFVVPDDGSAAGLRIPFAVADLVGNISFWGFKLEEGDIATPYQARPIGEELALCQRYFQTNYADSLALTLYTPNGDTRGSSIRLPVTMRIIPAASGSSVSGAVIWFGSGSGVVNTPTCTFTSTGSTVNSYTVQIAYPAGAFGGGNPIINLGCFPNLTSELDAEIY